MNVNEIPAMKKWREVFRESLKHVDCRGGANVMEVQWEYIDGKEQNEVQVFIGFECKTHKLSIEEYAIAEVKPEEEYVGG